MIQLGEVSTITHNGGRDYTITILIMIYHITPINDLKDHVDKSSCECSPTTEVLENGDIIITHNSYDGREGLELANEILK